MGRTAPSRDELAITAIENEMASAQSAEGVTRTWDDNAVWYDISGEVVGNKAATTRTAHQLVPISNIRTKIIRMTVSPPQVVAQPAERRMLKGVSLMPTALKILFRR